MISLVCPACHKRLNVKNELAGKKVRFPHCKQAIDIPASTVALESASSPRPEFADDGAVPPLPDSPNDDATVALRVSAQMETVFAPQTERNGEADHDKPREALKAEAHYEVEGEIARGGMGAIMRAVDQDIRREVAVKFLLNHSDAKQKARFVEEAQITGQLEHPNIVPIHQLGVHPDGRCFFSMKMVKGQSLAEILKDDESAYSLSRLLNIFVSICNAMAYAHSRHVIHRDLKPANVMVGDFGEVYVMDLGLAKALGAHSEATEPERQRGAEPATSLALRLGQASSVTTTRERVGELTQVGAIMGTPAYMPPEQARGEEVDQRTDIYSLGAILYEIMTRTPPVGRGGDMMEILMRVAEGQIDPPAKRSPERARAGWIPLELSAIAMKALAKEPTERYQTVESLRRDLELFLEGRSVSAKHDTFREMAWKLVKRNKGASITAAAALVVLAVVAGFFLKSNYEARVVAETERGKAEVERGKAEEAYQAYQKQVKDSAPVLLRAAKAALNERKFDDALAQASLAAKSNPESAEARLLTGELLITRQRFTEALSELEEVLKLKGEDAEVRKLAELCRNAQPEDAVALLAFADVFTQRQQHALADGVLSGQGKTALEARQRVLEIFRKRIETAWPGQGPNLTMNPQGQFSLKLSNVSDLSPLKGIPLTTLDLTGNGQIRDLEPLKGTPLLKLSLVDCTQLRDLTPLAGMSLTSLDLARCPHVKELAPLRGMPLTELGLSNCRVLNLEPLKNMPLTYLNLRGTGIQDLTLLRGMPLALLDLGGCYQVRDLEPLRGMPLTHLHVASAQVSSLEPLKGMPLTGLNLSDTPVHNLEPLRGMPLTSLELGGCSQVRDLEPLRGMQLTLLGLSRCKQVKNLELLKDMPLTLLSLSDLTEVRDLEFLKGKPLKYLNIINTGVTDLKPLQGMELPLILLTPRNITQGLEILRDMKSLKFIGIGNESTTIWPPAEFWKKYDAGEFKN